MKKVMLSFGTRPEAIKMCPVAKELLMNEEIKLTVCLTGQHGSMLSGVTEAFGIRADYDLGVMREGQSLDALTSSILSGVSRLLGEVKPDILLVHGDTTTAYASALAAFYQNIPIGHVEAGLRSGDISSPFPEELNRRAISLISKYDFAPTERAVETLIKEGKPPHSVFLTGNTVIDALRITLSENFKSEILDAANGARIILLTAHRRENLGEPMKRMFSAIRRVAEEVDDVIIVFPVHKNPVVREAAALAFSGCERVILTEPLDVFEFHNIMKHSYLIVTDSGGIQEEAPALKKPVLLMRKNTERPESVESGAVMLVGTDEGEIYSGIMTLLTDKEKYRKMTSVKNPYGDGFAARRIADIVENA